MTWNGLGAIAATLGISLTLQSTALGSRQKIIQKLDLPLGKAELRESFGRLGNSINEGITLKGTAGSRIVSAARGRVIQAGVLPDYQNAVIVDHGRFFTVYAGVGQIDVKKGDWVEALAPLGQLGTGPLHFEVRLESGESIDPLDVLKFKIHGQTKKLDETTVTEILVQAGFPKHIVPVFSCIAYYESGWRPHALNTNTNRTLDTGLWQINDVNHTACGIQDRKALMNPHTNARCAYTVWKQQGLRAWMAYRKKKAVCDQYRL